MIETGLQLRSGSDAEAPSSLDTVRVVPLSFVISYGHLTNLKQMQQRALVDLVDQPTMAQLELLGSIIQSSFVAITSF